jgi:hypothetical protein
MSQPGFFDLDECYLRLPENGDPLMKLAALIDFEAFRRKLVTALKRSDGSKGGRPPDGQNPCLNVPTVRGPLQGLDVLRRHESDLVALLLQDVAKVVSAAARLHRHRGSRQFGAQPDNAVSRKYPPKDDTARLVETRDATAVLTEIDTQHGDRHRSLLSPDHVRLAPTPKEGRAIP